MSISKGAFGQSAKGAFIESPFGVRGWGGLAELYAATNSNSGSNLYGLTRAGATKWRFSLNSTAGAIAPGSLSAYGNMGMDDESVYVPMARQNAWFQATGYASVLAVNNDGSFKWAFDSGGSALCTYALGDGSVVVGGQRTNTWTGAGGFANIWKLDSTGVVVWSYDAGSSITDLTCDASGNTFACVAGAPATLIKLNSSGTYVTTATALPASVTEVIRVDCDSIGVIYVTLIDGGFAPLDQTACLTNNLATLTWVYSAGTSNRACTPRAMNSSQDVMQTHITVGWQQLLSGSAVALTVDVGTQSLPQWAADLSVEDTVMYGYIGGNRTTSWAGSSGRFANLVKVRSVAGSYPPSPAVCEWGIELVASSNSEIVHRVASKKHWNAV